MIVVRTNVRSKYVTVTIHQAGFHLALCVNARGENNMKEEGSLRNRRMWKCLKNEITLWDRKNEGTVRDTKEMYLYVFTGSCSLIQTRQKDIRCTYVCMLNCIVPDVGFGERKKNQPVPVYIELAFTSLYSTYFALVL